MTRKDELSKLLTRLSDDLVRLADLMETAEGQQKAKIAKDYRKNPRCLL